MRGTKILVTVFLLSLLGLLSLEAEDGYRVRQVVFLPPHFYVGDTVELRIKVEPEQGYRIRVPSKYPSESWITFHSIRILSGREDTEIRIEFSPFFAGTRTLPEIRLGDVTLKNIKLHTSSLIEEGKEFAGPMGQVLIPGTRLYVVLLVSILTVIFLIVFPFHARIRRQIERITAGFKAKRPYKNLIRNLTALNKELNKLSSREYYIVLTGEFKQYLSNKTSNPFFSSTTGEITNMASDWLPVDFPSRKLLSVLRRGDLAKFGGKNFSDRRRRKDLEGVREMAKFLEGEVE